MPKVKVVRADTKQRCINKVAVAWAKSDGIQGILEDLIQTLPDEERDAVLVKIEEFDRLVCKAMIFGQENVINAAGLVDVIADDLNSTG